MQEEDLLATGTQVASGSQPIQQGATNNSDQDNENNNDNYVLGLVEKQLWRDHNIKVSIKLISDSTKKETNSEISNINYEYPALYELHSQAIDKLSGNPDHIPKYRKYACSTCPRGFKTEDALKRHLQHVQERLTLRCPHCSKGYVDLRKHRQTRICLEYYDKLNAIPDTNTCPHCLSEFSTKSNLNRHVRNGTCKKSFQFTHVRVENLFLNSKLMAIRSIPFWQHLVEVVNIWLSLRHN